MIKLLIICLALSSTLYGGDIIIKNTAGNTVEVRSKSQSIRIGIGQTKNLQMDNIFKTDVKVFYMGKMVTSTQIKPSNSSVKLEIYKEKGAWLIRPRKY